VELKLLEGTRIVVKVAPGTVPIVTNVQAGGLSETTCLDTALGPQSPFVQYHHCIISSRFPTIMQSVE
jgi:hypothetical protein